MAYCRIILHLLLAILIVYVSYLRQMLILEQRVEFLEIFPSSPSPNNSSSLDPDPRWQIYQFLLSAKPEEKLETGNFSSRPIEYDFYRDSCPKAEQIVQAVVEDLYRDRPEVAPALLRLLFHDCFI